MCAEHNKLRRVFSTAIDLVKAENMSCAMKVQKLLYFFPLVESWFGYSIGLKRRSNDASIVDFLQRLLVLVVYNLNRCLLSPFDGTNRFFCDRWYGRRKLGEKVVEPSVGTGSSAGCNSSTGTGSSAGSFSESPVIWDTAMFGSLERRLIYSRTMFNVHKKYEYNASEINEYQDYIYVSSKKASLSDARHFDLWRTSQYNGVLLSNAIKNLNLNTF